MNKKHFFLLIAVICSVAVSAAEVKQITNLADRKTDYPPVFEFQKAEPLTVAVTGSGSAEISTDPTHLFFGKGGSSVRVAFKGMTKESVIRVMLKTPVAIKNDFSEAEIYLWGTKWGYSNNYRMAVLVKNAKGEEEKIPIRYHFQARGPILYHTALQGVRKNYSFAGVEFTEFTKPDDELWLGPACFFEPEMTESDARAISNEEARRGRGIVPYTTAKNSIQKDNGAFLIQCGDITYTYKPSTGTLNDLTFMLEGKKVTPFADGGLLIGNERIARNAQLSRVEVKDNAVHARFEIDDRKVGSWGEQRESNLSYSITLTPVGKSLTIDVTTDTPFASKLVLGCITGLKKPKLIEVPYLCYWGMTNGFLGPRIVCDEAGNFMLAMLDPYVTNSSDLFAAEKNGFIRRRAVFANGGATYWPNTAGERNCVDERIVLTISKEVADILPNIDNPDPLNKDLVKGKVYCSWPHVYRFVPDLFHFMGFEDLFYVHYYNNSVPMDLKLTAGTGRAEAWHPLTWKEMSPKEFAGIVESYGYEFCVYEYLYGMQIGDFHWNRDWITRRVNGRYAVGCAPFFVTKPTILNKWRKLQDKWLLPLVKGVYSDVLTVGCPWGNFTDYDADVPGSASCRASYREVLKALRQIQETYGKSWSEGSFNWLYSGNCTGSYGSIMTFTEGGPSVLPIIPEFKLRRMQTKETTLSMGPSMKRHFERNKSFKSTGFPDTVFYDQALAAIIGYGNQTIVISEDYSFFGFSGLAKNYYMGKGIQTHYSFQPVKSIEYFDGDRAVKSSEALVKDIHKAGRLKTVYQNGTTVFVNYNGEKDWTIDYNGQKIVLPPWGFYAIHPESGTVSASVMIDGKRCEYSICKEYFYIDSRKEKVTFNGVTVKGAVALKKSADGKLLVIPLGRIASYRRLPDHFGCEELSIDLKQHLPGAEGKNIEVTCSALAGDKSQYSLFYKQGNKDKQILDRSRKPVMSEVKDGKLSFQPAGYYLNYFVGVK